jgi:peroxiredoxin
MPAPALSIGDPAPPFVGLKGVDGRPRALTDFNDARLLLVVFSCNHCPYVQGYEERMIRFALDNAPRGVAMAAINANDAEGYPEDGFEEMVRRARDRGFPFAYLRDEDQSVARAYGATHTPEFFLFGPPEADGRRRLCYHGKFDDNFRKPEEVKRRFLQEAVDDLLAGRPVREPETHSIGCTVKWKAGGL